MASLSLAFGTFSLWHQRWAQRLFLAWLLLAFWGWLFVTYPLYLVLTWLPSRWAWPRHGLHLLNRIWGTWLLLAWGSWPTVERRAPLPAGPVIVVANHRSYLDIPVLHIAIARPFRMLGKAELTRVPLFGKPYRHLHLTFDRRDARQSARALLQAEDLLRRGISIVIFPEGTTQRQPDELLGPFKEGAFRLATRSGCPVVPMALHGTRDALSNDNRFYTRPASIQATFCPPIAPAGQTPAQLAQAARQAILAELEG